MNLLNNHSTTKRPERILLLAYYDPRGISAVAESVKCLQRMSQFQVTLHNLFEYRANRAYFALTPSVNTSAFDAIVIHNSVSYDYRSLAGLDDLVADKLRDFEGPKLLFRQDENHYPRELAEVVGEIGFDVILTCLPSASVPLVYPPEKVGTPGFERMLTGYVLPSLRAFRPKTSRPIDIGYRGSVQPLSFGRLAYEKRRIGEEVARRVGSDYVLDISSRWEDRIGGSDWLDFLGRCKATLGTESGASIFDLDGNLDERIRQLHDTLGPEQDDAEYAEAFLNGLDDIEDRVDYGQLSPRHFEAAAAETLQILFPGSYSGVLEPHKHYFPLERDYSNLGDALELIDDEPRRRAITGRARKDLVDSPDYWIESFVRRVDKILASEFDSHAHGTKHATTLSDLERAHIAVICAHAPSKDPRIGWITDWGPADLTIHSFGSLRSFDADQYVRQKPTGSVETGWARQRWTPEFELGMQSRLTDLTARGVLGELVNLRRLRDLTDYELGSEIGIAPEHDRLATFRWYLTYLLDTSATLLDNGSRLEGLGALVATDLDTLPACLILKSLLNVRVLYDAHEYWPESDSAAVEAESDFLSALEGRLVPETDARQTVSRPLAEFMSERYETDFASVPNCQPLETGYAANRPRHGGSTCDFLYQGSIAEHRGIEELIEVWPSTDASAHLHIRGPDNSHKEMLQGMAATLGLINERVFFPAAVDESELVEMARSADVGLVPYMPRGTNYRFCCPNKLSQYMAAGLPVLANRTVFVEEVVNAAGAGLVIDFNKRSQLIKAVGQLTKQRSSREEMGSSGHSFYVRSFHWQNVSGAMYQMLRDWTVNRPRSNLRQADQVSRPGLFRERVEVLQGPGDTEEMQTDHTTAAIDESAETLAEPYAKPAPSGLLHRAYRMLPESTRDSLRPTVYRIMRAIGGKD